MYTVSLTINVKNILHFDYSDKIIVYLNGKAIFKGNNAFGVKGMQHMGQMDINTKIYTYA